MPQVDVRTLGLKRRFRFEDPNVKWVRNGFIYVGVACWQGQTFDAVEPLSLELRVLLEKDVLEDLGGYSVFATYEETFENMVYKSLLAHCREGKKEIELPLNNICQQIIVRPATEDTRYSFRLIDKDGGVAFERNNLKGVYNEHSFDLPLTMVKTIHVYETSRDEEFFVKLKFERAHDMDTTLHHDRGFHVGAWR